MTERLLAGAARREITPPVGTPLSGFVARLGASTGVLDPLHVRALVVHGGDRVAAVVQADLLGFSAWQVAEVRDHAHRALGIPREAVMLSATHTHSGPGLCPLRGCAMAPYEYQWAVVAAIGEALAEAHDRLAPASLEVGSAPFDLGVNRRQETPDGVVLGVAPEKPRPTAVEIALVRTASQRVLLFSHACHPYVLGGESALLSGDFPSLACGELEAGGDTVALFLNGCAGDVAPRSAFAGADAARADGARLAEAVRRGCERLTEAAPAPVLAVGETAHLPFAPLPTVEEIDRIAGGRERTVRPEERERAEVLARLDRAHAEWAAAMRAAVEGRAALEPVRCEVQAIRLGDLALLGVAGEPFFEIGERARAASPLATTWALGYTNAYCGYIPTRAEYPGGGYEVDDSWKYVGLWKLDETCEARVLDAARRVLLAVSA